MAFLLSPGSAGWLGRVASLLRGFRNVPLVMRHHVVAHKAVVEVRRWSETGYVRLDDSLWLSPAGELFVADAQKRRWIRQHLGEHIYDEVFALARVARPSVAQLELVLDRLMSQHGSVFWAAWDELSCEHRARLARVEHGWHVLRPALEARALDILPVLLSPEAHPRSRAALLEAGAEGAYAPPAEVLPWLLLQVEWNLSPGVLGLARASIARHGGQAWELRSHPNVAVRRRLVQLLPSRLPWVDWLMVEADPTVRQALRLRVEEDCELPVLAEQLRFESEPARKGALGWLLMHWSKPVESRRIFQSVEGALSVPQREILERRRREGRRRV
ncbi:MAG: hypothetical protein KF760_24560 [Candidatus Eremiobacteraeota bacterium]|nr:hypothetical protein [Candidatus Eremiobacteraeota bacterium]